MARITTHHEERGQLLLVAALGLAVLLVVLALILSTSMHTGTTATGASDSLHEEREATGYQESAHRGVSGIIERVNENDTSSYEGLEENASNAIDDWNDVTARQYAGDGRATNVSLVSVTNGTYVVQDAESRDFTNRSGTTDWTVAESVSSVRGFRMTVTEDRLYEPGNGACTDPDDCFTVEVENGSAVWRALVYSPGNSSTVYLRVETPSGDSDECTASNGSARIDFTKGTVDDQDCEVLSFGEGVSAPYNVTYRSADEITGRYELTVDRELSSSPHFDADGSPSIEPAIYAANVSVTYRSPALTYETEIRVVPGEEDA